MYRGVSTLQDQLVKVALVKGGNKTKTQLTEHPWMWKNKTVAKESPFYSILLRKTGNALQDHTALWVSSSCPSRWKDRVTTNVGARDVEQSRKVIKPLKNATPNYGNSNENTRHWPEERKGQYARRTNQGSGRKRTESQRTSIEFGIDRYQCAQDIRSVEFGSWREFHVYGVIGSKALAVFQRK
ncbi:hypothetical protein B0H14DRAFT_2592694 [Mycena olivaceomarginata]|nr:hypothetical protein B0H14DRAFT_2592694 [Mycena olivaceomarginata]